MISLVVATLNDGTALRAVAHFNTESKCAWFQIGDGLPQFATTPGPAEFQRLMAG